jgi:hypothetical protein
LKRTIITLSKELENQRARSGRHQEAEYAELFHQIDAAKHHLEERTVTLSSLETTRAQTRAAIQWQIEITDGLTNELAILKSIVITKS